MQPLTVNEEFQTRTWDKIDGAVQFLQPKMAGIAEIKPHTAAGQRSGLDQLRKYKSLHPDRPQWLITYLPINESGSPVRSGRAGAVKIFARSVDWPGGGRGAYRLGSLEIVGTKKLPGLIAFPRVDQPGFFGHAVEKHVRAHLFRSINRKAVRGTGGAQPGPDVMWKELAALYGELARIVPDPLYAEIAAELGVRVE
ncbi:hypothetical protein [Rhodococcus sp. A14]|uniref:hypothetical protein n=1 Tax=Rhodococcus sp. A14 TaxID=1194106 RepID=UPI001422AA3A|nr:hypothetical protein [Rhodococcus sp. A14]